MMNQANQKFISRKNCVLAAIESQLEEQRKFYPNRKIALVIFGSDVTVIGDGFQPETTIAGDKLQSYDSCFQEGEKLQQTHIQAPVSDSYSKLIEKFSNLAEKGQTALGPALAVSLGLLKNSKPGSKILLCTDGLANIGVGSLDGDDH